MVEKIHFIDLGAQRRRLGAAVDRATLRVFDHGQFINGPEVAQFEQALADYCGVKHVIGCSSGADALLMTLMAWQVGPGDAVFCPGFTFCAAAEVAALVGATPVFVDIDETTFNMSSASLARSIKTAQRLGLKPKAVIPVDLFGQSADHDSITAIAREHDLRVLDDAAQGFGATYKGRRLGVFGDATATSFFPAKPLGAYGDGGAVFTDDAELAATLRSIRMHGHGVERYDHVRLGLTGRLDTVQAAILIEKLAIFDDEVVARNAAAKRYEEGLSDIVATPQVVDGNLSVWAQYTIRLPRGRDAFAAKLNEKGVPTAIHYPRAMHQQTAYRDYPVTDNGLPVSEMMAREVISLPMHPYLDAATQDRIIDATRDAIRQL